MSIVPGRDVPAVPQAWVDAVNEAINDANHEDLCSSLHDLADCDSYKPGQWDTGVDLTIAVGVLEPLIRQCIGGEFTQAAEVLGQAIRDLDAHIRRRADEIAEPRCQSALDAANKFIAEGKEAIEFEKQRHANAEAELRKWIAARDRQVEQQATRIAALAATVERVRAVRCWENEDGKWFAFRDDLYAALNGEVCPS